jgi:hypothetical protein
LDCAEPDELAAFYLRLLGGRLLWSNADSAGGTRAGPHLGDAARA